VDRGRPAAWLGLGAGENLNEHVVGEGRPSVGVRHELLIEQFEAAGGAGKPKVGQVAVAYDPDREAAVARAHEQFRWFGLRSKVNADLPNPDSFEAAMQSVTPEQVAAAIACGPPCAPSEPGGRCSVGPARTACGRVTKL
jgi:hypothetical protein